MNAIERLESQHRDIERLFSRLETATKPEAKEKLFKAIADKLAIHAAVEEQCFYPAVKRERTEDLLVEALEEHLRIKRLLANLLETEASDESFDAKVKFLKEQVEHHAGELESELFPRVKKLLAEDELEALAKAMSDDQRRLEAKVNARKIVRSETAHGPL
jgi:hemerythrin superfamily protein